MEAGQVEKGSSGLQGGIFAGAIKRTAELTVHRKAVALKDVQHHSYPRFQTGLGEFDRVMGSGMTHSSLTLLAGEPGIGKSTLLMSVCASLLTNYPGMKVLYVCAEESEEQVAKRAQRLGVSGDQFYLLHESSWERVYQQLNELVPDFIVIDSIQTIVSDEINSASGTLTQIREVTFELMNYCKTKKATAMIIGHVTKEGAIAGPKLLEHMVDTVLYFEGDQQNFYRLVRATKNRFGSTHEVGIFEMKEQGLVSVDNPSAFFVQSEEGSDRYGRAISCLIEGSRALLVEVQALVTENKYGNGRRTTQGVDTNRVAMLVAIIEKYFGIPLSFHDIYINVAGGIKLEGRESDLAIMAAILSSYGQKSLPKYSLFLGEVGLTGDIRPVWGLEQRLKESIKLGRRSLILAVGKGDYQQGLSKEAIDQCEWVGLKSIFDLKAFFTNIFNPAPNK